MKPIVTSIALCIVLVLGALAEDNGLYEDDESWEDEYGIYDASSAGQTGQIQYEMSEGTATVNLPPGYALHHTFAGKDENKSWTIEARTPGKNYDYDILIVMGYPGSFQDAVDETIAYNSENNNPNEGRYIETSSGYKAWIEDLTGSIDGLDQENSHTAFVDYTSDGSRYLTVIASEMSNEIFEGVVKSIEVEKK